MYEFQNLTDPRRKNFAILFVSFACASDPPSQRLEVNEKPSLGLNAKYEVDKKAKGVNCRHIFF